MTNFGSSSANQYHSPNPSFGRNLTQDQLGGVVFGTKNCTIKECLTKQLFGKSFSVAFVFFVNMNLRTLTLQFTKHYEVRYLL